MNDARFRCVVCGKLTSGRLPRQGRHKGDGTVYYPRRHKDSDGEPCRGNVLFAEWVEPDGTVHPAVLN